MELQISPPAAIAAGSDPCCRRSVKRKLDTAPVPTGVALVEVETEVTALREALAAGQQSIRDLCAELEEERNASASAANETMSMILRLQHEKAEVVMESRQFKRFAEEKMAHDQQEIFELEDLLYKREEELQSLASEVEAYRHRLLSYGIDPPSPPAELDIPSYDYPPLRCSPGHEETNNGDDYATLLNTDECEEDIHNIEDRIRQLETSPSGSEPVMEKGMLAGEFESAQEFKEDEFPATVDRSDEGGSDDGASDRVYTIDAVHESPVEEEQCRVVPEERRDSVGGGGEVEEGDIKKLYSRLQALEADRESMKQALISMRTEKAQLVLLREIAQQLCKEAKPEPEPERRVVKKASLVEGFWSFAVFKWIVSILTWRRKASQSKYTFGMTKNNAGLLLLLDKSPSTRHSGCLRGTRRWYTPMTYDDSFIIFSNGYG